ncbi:vitelline membrane outer layer protein 1 homolog [Daphnia carinata]|uniref:vitelline membrane outer layer protein 1 homolog n=1 Tax=Daphnia carinata TaxID=120202 RepID=UPI00257F55D7|nr:vitelline membrane outer layer protein 1 homolog [Daphnia carinata]
MVVHRLVAFFVSFLMLSLVLQPRSTEALKIISVTNGGTEGSWGLLEICPDGSRAIGYQTQNDPLDVILYDKTAMNSIRLFCNDTAGTSITSILGDTGTWELRQNCPPGEALSSFRLRVETYDPELSDNTSVNSIQFYCTDGTLLNFNGNSAGIWGDFSAENCDLTGICGLETRVMPMGTLGDNTALNNVGFLCC